MHSLLFSATKTSIMVDQAPVRSRSKEASSGSRLVEVKVVTCSFSFWNPLSSTCKYAPHAACTAAVQRDVFLLAPAAALALAFHKCSCSKALTTAE